MGRDARRGAAADRRPAVRRRARLGRRCARHQYPASCLMPGVTIDAGGLIALDRDDRRVVVLLARARETGARVTVPASVLAQAIRRPDRQVRLSRFIRQPTTEVISLGRVDATNVGRLLAASGTSDIADAHVVICARRADSPSSHLTPVTCASLTLPSG